MNPHGEARAGVAATLVWTALVMAVFIGGGQAGVWLSERQGLSPPLRIAATGIVPALLAIAAVLGVVRRQGETWRDAGLRLPRGRALVVGALAGAPLAVAYVVLLGPLGQPPTLVPNAALVAAKFVVAQGLAEELIFRGFVFRTLRQGRSFLRAATLSAAFFSVVHLANFVHGFSPEVVVGVLVSTAFAFVLAYPAALLFERAGGSILPFALTHTLIDSINLFPALSRPGVGLYVYLAAVLATAGSTVLLARRLLPDVPASVQT